MIGKELGGPEAASGMSGVSRTPISNLPMVAGFDTTSIISRPTQLENMVKK